VLAVLAAVQSHDASEQTTRAAYDALKVASETNSTAIEACRKSQIDLRVWVEELSARIERRAASVPRPRAAPPVVEPAPPAPAAPVAQQPAQLPAFDKLADK